MFIVSTPYCGHEIYNKHYIYQELMIKYLSHFKQQQTNIQDEQ